MLPLITYLTPVGVLQNGALAAALACLLRAGQTYPPVAEPSCELEVDVALVFLQGSKVCKEEVLEAITGLIYRTRSEKLDSGSRFHQLPRSMEKSIAAFPPGTHLTWTPVMDTERVLGRPFLVCIGLVVIRSFLGVVLHIHFYVLTAPDARSFRRQVP